MTTTEDRAPVGVAVMAYGTPASLDDLEAYYTHIRRGRAPGDEQLAELRSRYEAIGGVSPLRERTEAQRAAIQRALDSTVGEGAFVSALGQKHASPFIGDAIAALADQGVCRVVGLVLAPHYSKASIGEYHERARAACEAAGIGFVGIDAWADEPAWLDFMARAVRDAAAAPRMPAEHHVVYTAHSLPERVLDGDPYPDGLHASALAISQRLGLARFGAWGLAWQSAGRTPEPWRGPDIRAVIRDLATTGKSGGIVVCAQGFTSDHLEVLYDLDVEAARVADEVGLAFARTRSLNDDPAVMAALATRIVSAAAQRPWNLGRVVVVGAGVAGLTAAYTILRDAPGTELTLVDSSDRAGGKLHTAPVGRAPAAVDAGADAFLARVPEAVALCRELGLGGRLTSPATGSAFLWLDGELRRLPEGLMLGVPTDLDSLTESGLLTPGGVDRLQHEADLPDDHLGDGDASVGEVVRRRLGDEAFERLVAPLLAGVHAGDADELSLATGAPQLADALRDHGALLAGVAARRAQAAPASDEARPPIFHGLAGGMQQLTDALLRAITDAGATVRLGTAALGLTAARLPGRTRPLYTVRVDDPHGHAQLDVDAVVIATPAAPASRIVEALAPVVAAELSAVRYASVALVTFVLPRAAVGHPLDGSGFLTVPPGYPDGDPELLLTACSFASTKWAHLQDPERVILRVSAGRAGDTRALELDDDTLVARLLADLQRTIDLDARLDPRNPDVDIRVTRWINALPQFSPGHLDRVRRSDEWLACNHPGLAVVGASRTGLGVPACIVRAQAEAARLITSSASARR